MYKRIVIGIDQSYQDTGVSVCADGKLIKLSRIEFESAWDNSRKRKEIKDRLGSLFERAVSRAGHVKVLVERVRLKSDGFININYIKAIGALNACIVDVAQEYGLKVFSVDTRVWKARVVGTSKPKSNPYGFDEKKWPTIEHIVKIGHGESIKQAVSKQKKKAVLIDDDGARYTYNDNIADSACIALYGFVGDSEKLEQER